MILPEHSINSQHSCLITAAKETAALMYTDCEVKPPDLRDERVASTEVWRSAGGNKPFLPLLLSKKVTVLVHWATVAAQSPGQLWPGITLFTAVSTFSADKEVEDASASLPAEAARRLNTSRRRELRIDKAVVAEYHVGMDLNGDHLYTPFNV